MTHNFLGNPKTPEKARLHWQSQWHTGGERRHTPMRLALVFQRFGPCSGVPALAVTFPRRPTDFQASWSHPTEKVPELRTVISGITNRRRTADPFLLEDDDITWVCGVHAVSDSDFGQPVQRRDVQRNASAERCRNCGWNVTSRRRPSSWSWKRSVTGPNSVGMRSNVVGRSTSSQASGTSRRRCRRSGLELIVDDGQPGQFDRQWHREQRAADAATVLAADGGPARHAARQQAVHSLQERLPVPRLVCVEHIPAVARLAARISWSRQGTCQQLESRRKNVCGPSRNHCAPSASAGRRRPSARRRPGRAGRCPGRTVGVDVAAICRTAPWG